MNGLNIFTIAALTFGISHAQAQTLPAQHFTASAAVVVPTTDARPGHIPGEGESLPLSSKASNIGSSDTHNAIAPTLPASDVGIDGSIQAYLLEARQDLSVAGRTGQAQQALEMAESRALSRVIPPGEASGPSNSALVSQISAARTALGNSDTVSAIRQIDLALAH